MTVSMRWGFLRLGEPIQPAAAQVQPPPAEGEWEGFLARLRGGDPTVRGDLFAVVYDELHRLARRFMASQKGHTLQPTALVNEAYVKLCGPADAHYASRKHFLCVAARAMRQVLLDHARRRSAEKRCQPGTRVELDGLADAFEQSSGGLVALGVALERLEERDPELAKLVELRFFSGYEVAEVAEIVGVSERTAFRLLNVAKLFLKHEMTR